MKAEKVNLVQRLNLKRPTVGQMIWWGAGLVLAIAAFAFLSSFVGCWRLTSLAGIPLPSCPTGSVIPVVNPEGTPVTVVTPGVPTVSAPEAALPQPWDGASRVTVLVLGLDYADWSADRSGPSRSDTMVLLTIDPISKTAGMISIPRDMLVNIPGYGYNKINTAYYFGEANKLPGGGPAMAMKAVEAFLGVPIQYYAQIDFTSFVKAIDDIGGVNVCVTAPIDVSRIYEITKTHLEPGCQTLDGIVALGYARNRHTANGDVDRAARTQQVIMGIRDKVLDPANFPTMVAQSTSIYNDISDGVHTNMSLPDALKLARLAYELPRENIKTGVIDYTMMEDGFFMLNGQQLAVLRPYPDKIRDLVDQIFGGGSMKPMATGDATQLMQAEAAKVVVVNGSGVAGMAQKTYDFLQGQGMNVIKYGNTTDYPDKYYSPFPDRTLLIVHAGKPYAMNYLSALAQFNTDSQIIVDFNPSAPEDIILALGYDWANSNPVP
jgi:LCP family protein required for cell wall assembly